MSQVKTNSNLRGKRLKKSFGHRGSRPALPCAQVDLTPRQLHSLPSGCTAACPELIEAFAAAARAQALEDPTEALKAVHQQMCLHQDWGATKEVTIEVGIPIFWKTLEN